MINIQHIGRTVIVVEKNDSVEIGKEFVVECESDAHFMSNLNKHTMRYNIIINKGYCELKNEN